MKFTGSRLKEWEKAKQGNLLDWIKSKTRGAYFFYTGGYRIVNIYSTQRHYVGNKITIWSHGLVPDVVPSKGLEKITLTFNNYVILDVKRQ